MNGNSEGNVAEGCETAVSCAEVGHTGRGTREWSDYSYNIALGCSHACLYCYARGIALRFGRIPDLERWQTMVNKPDKVEASHRRFPGVVMFPTAHDITPELLPFAVQTLKGLLGAGNRVLVVSKPHLQVVRELCHELFAYQQNIQFRFTIGSLSRKTCSLWEPGAPEPKERIAALEHAFKKGYQTSVSMEPMLGDKSEMCQLVARVSPFVSHTIWLGKLNGGIPKAAQALPGVARSLQNIRGFQTDAKIMELCAALQSNPKIHWKDSIKQVLARNCKPSRPRAWDGS